MKKSEIQKKLFEEFIEGRFPVTLAARLAFSSIGDIYLSIIRNLQGPFGLKLRQMYWKNKFKYMGKNVLLDTELIISGAENISISEYTWIDSSCRLDAILGDISIGKRVHIAHGSILSGGGGLIIEDYVGLSAGAKIYSHTEVPREGKRMSGPMIPWRYKAFISEPVILKKDSFIGANAVVLPGVTIGEGAVVGANSLVTKSIPDYKIAIGIPAKVIGRRSRVTQPDL
jgi:acetyltransferase-like isoleucine patch superfamily enzyme